MDSVKRFKRLRAQGKSWRECEEITGIPSSTMWSRIKQANESLPKVRAPEKKRRKSPVIKMVYMEKMPFFTQPCKLVWKRWREDGEKKEVFLRAER